MKKRVFAFLLVFFVLVGILPASVSAADEPEFVLNAMSLEKTAAAKWPELTDYYWYCNIQCWEVYDFRDDGSFQVYYTEKPFTPSENKKLTQADFVSTGHSGHYDFDGKTLTIYREDGWSYSMDLYDKNKDPFPDNYASQDVSDYDGTIYFYETNWKPVEIEGMLVLDHSYLVRLGKKQQVSPFVDVQNPNSYCYDAVLWAVENGVTNGIDETHFAPDRSCTRAQIVTFLWRAAGSPEPSSHKNPFTDVKDGPYYKAILWAVENGITKGTTATTFAPNAACTRGQIVTFIYRAAGEPEIQNSNNPFQDVKGGAYYHAILWAVENGITKGTTATTFAPSATCTRGQGVTFLYRGRDLLQ